MAKREQLPSAARMKGDGAALRRWATLTLAAARSNGMGGGRKLKEGSMTEPAVPASELSVFF